MLSLGTAKRQNHNWLHICPRLGWTDLLIFGVRFRLLVFAPVVLPGTHFLFVSFPTFVQISTEYVLFLSYWSRDPGNHIPLDHAAEHRTTAGMQDEIG